MGARADQEAAKAKVATARAAVVENMFSKATDGQPPPVIDASVGSDAIGQSLDTRETVKSIVNSIIVGGSHEAQSRAAVNAGSFAALAMKRAGYETKDQVKAAAAAAQQVVLGRVLQGSAWSFKKLHTELVWPGLVAAKAAGADVPQLAAAAKKHLQIALVWQ